MSKKQKRQPRKQYDGGDPSLKKPERYERQPRKVIIKSALEHEEQEYDYH
jgi:hypothetical protein